MKRLASLDALRGFDMMWIMGGCGVLCTLMELLGFAGFGKSFGHVEWEGLQFMDTVFPTFLFLAGASFPFSCAKSLEKGLSRRAIALKALRRGVTLIVLGWVYQGFLQKLDFATYRIPSVLGYIGFGWMCAAWIYLATRRLSVRVGISAGILAAVSLIFGLIPAPDAATVVIPENMGWAAELGRGVFTPAGNLSCWLDRVVMGVHKLNPLFDNEGLGGLPCTIVTAMLGMLAGDIVRAGAAEATGRKALGLLAAAAGCLVSGLALSCFFPIVKNLWSPSFVLVVGAYSFAMFALFYWIVDVKGWTRWSFFFRVIGMNSITIYLAQRFISFQKASDFFLGGLGTFLPTDWAGLLSRVGYVAACWLFLYFLYKKNVFLKV